MLVVAGGVVDVLAGDDLLPRVLEVLRRDRQAVAPHRLGVDGYVTFTGGPASSVGCTGEDRHRGCTRPSEFTRNAWGSVWMPSVQLPHDEPGAAAIQSAQYELLLGARGAARRRARPCSCAPDAAAGAGDRRPEHGRHGRRDERERSPSGRRCGLVSPQPSRSQACCRPRRATWCSKPVYQAPFANCRQSAGTLSRP